MDKINDESESLFKYRGRAKQLIDFSGLQFGTITPTDIDGCFELNDEARVFLEYKCGNATMPLGQKLALTRMADDFQQIGKEATVFECEHHDYDYRVDVDAAAAIVRRFYYKGKWYEEGHVTVREKMENFLKYLNKLKRKY